jgi:DNA-binding transcriptional MerR regulator
MAIAAVKSPEAFRTISEVATELDVPQHVLRFWESRFSQIRPVKRAGGRRYYRPDDIDLLRGIRALLYTDGYTIKGVQKILRAKGVRSVAELGRNGALPTDAQVVSIETFEKPRHARAAIARVHEAHAELVSLADFKPELDDAARTKLQHLQGELSQMKQALRAARERLNAPVASGPVARVRRAR